MEFHQDGVTILSLRMCSLVSEANGADNAWLYETALIKIESNALLPMLLLYCEYYFSVNDCGFFLKKNMIKELSHRCSDSSYDNIPVR